MPVLLTTDETADLQVTRTTPIAALPELLTPKEFGAVAGLRRATTYDLIRRGLIPSVRFGRVIRWSIVLDLGYQVDTETGLRKRRQKWITVRGTKRDAGRKLAELIHRADTGSFIEPSKVTVGEWLDTWLEKAIKPHRRTLSAYETYKSASTSPLENVFRTLPTAPTGDTPSMNNTM